MATRRERIIELGAVIAADRLQLQTIKERIKASEVELDRLLARDGGDDARPDGEHDASAGEHSGTLAQAIVDMLNAMPNVTFTPIDVSREVGTKIETVRSTLARLAATGRIAKQGHGRYQALRANSAPLLSERKEVQE